MAEAIFGLVGVVVGAVVTGAVEWSQSKRARAIPRRAAVRLVVDELDQAVNVLELAQEHEQVAGRAGLLRKAIDHGLVRDDAWIAHRSTLAETLTKPQWDALSVGYVAYLCWSSPAIRPMNR
jgi:hypothetical protein